MLTMKSTLPWRVSWSETWKSYFHWYLRPLSLGEIVEALAIDYENESFDSQDRVPNPHFILEICKSLVSLSDFEVQKYPWETRKVETVEDRKELQFAHYSVAEYLLSNRILERGLHEFHVSASAARNVIMRLSIVYLLSIQKFVPVSTKTLEALPLLEYVSCYWYEHYRSLQTESDPEQAHKLAVRGQE